MCCWSEHKSLNKCTSLIYRVFRLIVSFICPKAPHCPQVEVQIPQPRIKSFPQSLPPFLLHPPFLIFPHKPPPRNPSTLSCLHSGLSDFAQLASLFWYTLTPHSLRPTQIIPTLYDLVQIPSLLKGMPNNSKELPSCPPHTFHKPLLYSSFGCILPWLLNYLRRALEGAQGCLCTW